MLDKAGLWLCHFDIQGYAFVLTLKFDTEDGIGDRYMEENIKKQSRFSRTLANEGKMGAYYTDPDHCRWIHNFLDFPVEKEICCLDPCIGDAQALRLVTGQEERIENLKLFGVESNKETCRELREKAFYLEELLQTDFIDGTIISHSSFSFCFMNPPYGMDEKERLENAFLGKVIPYLTNKAVLVLVIPLYVAKSLAFLKRWCGNFETLHYYRFHEKEYQKFKQVVLFGRKKCRELLPDEMKRMAEIEKEELEEIPTNYLGERIEIYPSKKEAIKSFLTKDFDAEAALDAVRSSPLLELLDSCLKIPPYGIGSLERPPVMPCNNQLYLLAMCGGGEGLAGTEEDQDLHLQRGIVKRVSYSSIEPNEEGVMMEVVKTTSKVSFNLIEADGTIRELA